MKKSNTPSTPEPSQKTPSDSKVVMTNLVLPEHTNNLGSIFGGTVMSWMDIAGAVAAMRHSRKQVVTASVDALHFIAPIKQGQIATTQATVNYAGKSSMEVGVRVDSEDPITGETHHNVSGYFTFVAIDEKFQPTRVPSISPQSAIEKKRFSQAKARIDSRIELAQKIKTQLPEE